MYLNKDSICIGQPEGLLLPLKHHQKAMLYKCLTIEKDNRVSRLTTDSYGILADPPGSGKTAVIMSLLLADSIIFGKKNPRTIIVVPSLLVYQWSEEFKKFCGDSLKIKPILKYSDTTLDDIENLLDTYNALLVSELLYETVLGILVSKETHISRIIFDELESFRFSDQTLQIKNKIYKKQKQVNCDIFWFVSASIPREGFYFKDFFIVPNEKNTCICSNEFLEDLVNTNIIFSTSICKNEIIDTFCNDLDFTTLQKLNSNLNEQFPKTYMIKLIEEVSHCIDKYTESIKFISEAKDSSAIQEADNYRRGKDILEKIIHNLHVKTYCYLTCNKVECLKKYISSTVEEDEISKDFIFRLELKQTVPGEKVIVTSGVQNSIESIIRILKEEGINFLELKGGNPEDLNYEICSYIKGNVDFLILDSSFQSFGLNLQVTDKIIFTHNVGIEQEKQVIGRAHRPGRKNELKIRYIYYKNESVQQ